jgi:CBS domain containing-hemolysin-like protein
MWMQEEIRKKTGYVVQRANGVYDVDANTSIEDLTDALEVKIPEVCLFEQMCRENLT